jgi:hypothetical protein
MVEMTKITGGKVSYGLTVCPKQYESKRGDVELTFTVGEGESYESIFDRASKAVINRCRQLVDLPKIEEKPAPIAGRVDPAASNLFGGS